MTNDEKWMRLALDEARLAAGKGEVPVGAVLVRGDNLLVCAHNLRKPIGAPPLTPSFWPSRAAVQCSAAGGYRAAPFTLPSNPVPCVPGLSSTPDCPALSMRQRIPVLGHSAVCSISMPTRLIIALPSPPAFAPTRRWLCCAASSRNGGEFCCLILEVMMWLLYAVASALFAGATSILAKCGIKRTDSNLATALRTGVVLICAWGMVFLTGAQTGLRSIDTHSLILLILVRPGDRRLLALLFPRAVTWPCAGCGTHR